MDRVKTRPLVAALAAAAVTALGVAGAAITQSDGSSPAKPAQERNEPETAAADRHEIKAEKGKEGAPDKSDKGRGHLCGSA